MAIELVYRGGSGAVKSVNGQIGDVVLTAADVGALPNDTVIPSIEGLASEEFVEKAIQEIDIPSIEGLASEEYVNKAVESIEIPEVNLEPYALKKDIPVVPSNVSAFNNDARYTTVTQVEEFVADALADIGGGGSSEWALIYELQVTEELEYIDDKTIDGTKGEYIFTIFVPQVETQIAMANNNFFGQRDIKAKNTFAITGGTMLHTVYVKVIARDEALYICDSAEKSTGFNDEWGRTRACKVVYGCFNKDWGLFIQNKVPAGTHIKIYAK